MVSLYSAPVTPQYAPVAAAPVSTLAMSPAGSGQFTMGPGPISLGLAHVGKAMMGLNKTHVWTWQHQVVRAAPPPATYAAPPTQVYQVVQQAPPPPYYQMVQQAPPPPIYQTVQQAPPAQTYQLVPVAAPPRPSEDAPPPPIVTSPSPQSPGKAR